MTDAVLDTIETARLRLSPVGESDQPAEFLEVFNTNEDFIEASEQFTGRRAYELSDAEMYLWQETNRENSRCLAIHLRDTGALVGTVCLLVPHDKEPYPWVGLLLIHGHHQRRGLGTEVVSALEGVLTREHSLRYPSLRTWIWKPTLQ